MSRPQAIKAANLNFVIKIDQAGELKKMGQPQSNKAANLNFVIQTAKLVN